MGSDHNKIVGKRVKDLYKAHGMTQAQLAEVLGYSDPNTISMIVNGHRALTSEKAMILVKRFPEVSLDWVMGRSDYKSKGEQAVYELAVSVVAQQMLDKAFLTFLDGTSYTLFTPEDIRKHIEPLTVVDYVLFKDDEPLPLSSAEIECLYSLIRNQIAAQIDYLFQQKEAKQKNAELMKQLQKLKHLERSVNPTPEENNKGAIE